MGRYRPMSLRAVFVVLVLVALLPLTVLSMRSALEARDRARLQVAEEAQRLARLAALRHRDLIESGRQLLQRISIGPTSLATERECPPHLEAIAATEPRFSNMGVVDAAGTLVCAAQTPEGPVDFADRDWFQEASASGEFSVGRYVTGRITGLPALVFALPLTDPEGEPYGIVWAALDLSWLQQFIASLELPGRPTLLVSDENGTILARAPAGEDRRGSAIPTELAPLLGSDVASVEAEDLDGVRRVFASVPLGTDADEGLVALGVPVTPALEAAEADVRRNLLGLLVAVVVGVGGAWLVGNRFVDRPARALVGASRRLAAGDVETRVEPGRWPSELAEVGEAFDAMAGALGSRTRELEKAVEERERSETRFRTLLEAAPDAIVGVDAEGVIRLVNRRTESLFGYRREELLGLPVVTLLEGPRALESLRGGIAPGGPSLVRDGTRLELVAQRRDGTTFPAEVMLAGLEAGPVVVSAAVRDITERVEAQAERARLEAQLHQAQRLESLGRLAGGVAHDYNNRLAVILNYADFIADSLPEDPPPQLAATVDSIREDLAAITRAGQAAAQLTRQLLIFGQRDVGRPDLLDVNAIVKALEPLLARTLGEDVLLRLTLGGGLAAVRVDPGRLEQALVDLAINARDAMPGGGELLISTESRVDDQALPPEGSAGARSVRIIVGDTGTGMTPEVAERAFEPFFTTKPRGEGSGLGLATVYGFVTEAGGQVHLETSPAAGTAVVIDLPVAPPGPDEGVEERLAPTESWGEETILLVEDEDPVREVTTRILVGAGFVVLAVEGGEEALALLREDPGGVDLLLSDVVMPGMAGPELAQHVRSIRPDLPVLYMSGYSEELLARRTRADTTDILPKPFTRPVLLRRVRLALDGHKRPAAPEDGPVLPPTDHV